MKMKMKKQMQIWVKDYIDYMKYERGFAKSTVQGRQKLLLQLTKFLNNRPLNTQTIREFIRHKAELKLSPYSLNDYIRDIKVFCKYLFETGKTPQDYSYPIKRFKIPEKQPKILTLQELTKLVYCPWRQYSIPRLKKAYDMLFELLAKTGMRRREIYMLDCGDFKFDEGVIHVRFAKGGKERFVPIPPDMIEKFKEWFEKRKVKPDTPVFLTRDSNRMKGETIRHELKLRAKAAGISSRVYPHLFRHSFITEMLRKDVAVAKVARIVGHANPMITMKTYEHLVVDDLKKAAAKHPLIDKSFQPKKKRKTRTVIKETVYIIKEPKSDLLIPTTRVSSNYFKSLNSNHLIDKRN